MISARGGFTLVETLAAMLFMAIVIPVTVQGLIISGKIGSTAQGKREAALLADQKLTELVATDLWRSGDQSGDFGEDWPGYEWEMTSEAWSEDTMRVVTVRVYYKVRGVEHSESSSTLADETQDDGTQADESAAE